MFGVALSYLSSRGTEGSLRPCIARKVAWDCSPGWLGMVLFQWQFLTYKRNELTNFKGKYAMSIGAFTDKKQRPSETEIRDMMGTGLSDWDELVQFVREKYSPEEEFRFLYGKKYGWALRFQMRRKLLTSFYPTEVDSPFRSTWVRRQSNKHWRWAWEKTRSA